MPSIEEPYTTPNDSMSDSTRNHNQEQGYFDDDSLPRGRTLAPPQTPAPGSAPSLSPKRYPDWSMDSYCSDSDSTFDCESSRPSTAISTLTSASMLSRFSCTSQDFQFMAMETEPDAVLKSCDENTHVAPTTPTGKKRRPQWTQPMSDHLWATYMAYIDDSKMTPIRFGKSGIPPQGVCARVARQAKRTWRGAKTHGNGAATTSRRSGSATPTGASQTSFMQWPHTQATTRSQLRKLCKSRAISSATRATQYSTRTPTPFGRAATRLRMRRTTPTPFSSKEMCMSLALSTCESMQPSGPLAQLTQATPEPRVDQAPAEETSFSNLDVPNIGRRRLASPFNAKSYGPSSSDALDAALALGPQRQIHTLGARCTLQSPARLTRSRSNTQKRRSRQSSLEPRRTKRPSLGSDLWVRPSTPPAQAAPTLAPDIMPTKSQTEFSSSSNNHHDELFVPRTNLMEMFTASSSGAREQLSSRPTARTFASVDAQPTRLGSPFTSTTSFSFPNRFIKGEPLSLGATVRPFATAQRHHDDASSSTRDLGGRMAYLDQRLREFRQRDANRRRSESPF